MKETRILITAFEPFGGEKINPAWEAAKRLTEKKQANLVLLKLQVPTVFGKALEKVKSNITNQQPDIIVSLGQAAGRTGIDIERIAINIDDATSPDNENNQPIDVPVVNDGPAAYFSTLPIKAMVEAIKGAGIPANVSNSAGTFVCNHLMYGLLHYIHISELPVKAGFIHLPYLPNQAVNHKGAPSMSLADMVAGLQIGIAKAAKLCR